jgi:predicted metalloprotease with PDZ domain
MIRLVIFSYVFTTTLILLSCSDDPKEYPPADYVTYEVNLNNRSEDRFKVIVSLPELSSSDNIFQFASTAPGLYSVTDVGRFIRDFRAFDKDGRPLGVEKISTNQFSLTDPENTTRIEYTSRDTWDTLYNGSVIAKMAGTSLEADHALINTYCLFGYPQNLKEQKMLVKLYLPSGWTTGTALEQNAAGYYEANDFDHLVDSPFLVGELTESTQTISDSEVDVFCYSADNTVTASQISASISDVIESAEQFLGDIPVDRYSFLFHYGEFYTGAWEHSYSSTYVIKNFDPLHVKWITAHEFFHIVTPLNIHSEIIQDFDFVTPTASQHLWLYEGVTEWAAFTMLMRANKISYEDYLDEMLDKIVTDRAHFDPDISLTELSRNSYLPQWAPQYGNVYYRGALVAMLLDIRLLELSGGEKGLREVVLELIDSYGPDTPFDEEMFFDILIGMTYPEIGQFIASYIDGHEEMPYAEYLSKVGLEFIDGENPTWNQVLNPTPEQTALFEAWTKNM